MIRSEYYLISLALPLYYIISFKQKTPIELWLSNKLNYFGEALNFNDAHLLSEEYKLIKKKLRWWGVITKDSKYLTYFRFIKLHEFILKIIAIKVNSINPRDQISLKEAIDIINTKFKLDKKYLTSLHKQRKLRNQFIHNLGLDLDISIVKPNITQSFQILNIVLTQ